MVNRPEAAPPIRVLEVSFWPIADDASDRSIVCFAEFADVAPLVHSVNLPRGGHVRSPCRSHKSTTYRGVSEAEVIQTQELTTRHGVGRAAVRWPSVSERTTSLCGGARRRRRR
jgi:hypothetical protein